MDIFGRKLPGIFSDRVFLLVLALKLIFAFLFASHFLTGLFIPFVSYFAQNPLSNPYQHFFELGQLKAFPYPTVMLLVMAVPFLIFGPFFSFAAGNAAIFIARLPLLAADLAIFYVLCRIFEGREKQVNLLYWCSPVIFYINYVHGQLDAIPIALLVASIYLLFAKKTWQSFALLVLGLASKSHLFVALPIYLIYLWKNRVPYRQIAFYFLAMFAIYFVMLSPYAASEGFMRLVFGASEQLRIFSLGVQFGPSLLFYLVPAAYLYIMFKAYSFKKITRDVFFMTVGLVFTLLVTLITPAQGWYLWSIPFIAYFFIKEKDMDPIIYHAFGAAYLLFFAFIPDSDIFSVFAVSSPQFASLPTPYVILSLLGVDADIVVSLLFTALSATLFYISYQIYKRGIKSSLLFQETNGIPAIGIAGDSGAGKTTLASLLSRLLGTGKTNIIYGDDVHKWERGHPNWSRYTHLNPVGNYINYNYGQIRDLKRGKGIMRPLYDHSTGKFTSPISILPRDYIISEGLHTLFIPEASAIYELKVYLDPHPALRRIWKLRRDVKSRDYTEKKVLAQMKAREADAERFVKRQKENADVVVSYLPNGKSLALQLDLRTYFAADALVEALSRCKGLSVSHEYLSTNFQRMLLRGKASSSELFQAMLRLGVDLADYGVDEDGFARGLDGALQTVMLFCLNERLKALSGGS